MKCVICAKGECRLIGFENSMVVAICIDHYDQFRKIRNLREFISKIVELQKKFPFIHAEQMVPGHLYESPNGRIVKALRPDEKGWWVGCLDNGHEVYIEDEYRLKPMNLSESNAIKPTESENEANTNKAQDNFKEKPKPGRTKFVDECLKSGKTKQEVISELIEKFNVQSRKAASLVRTRYYILKKGGLL